MYARWVATLAVGIGAVLVTVPAAAQPAASSAGNGLAGAPAPWLQQDPGDSLYRAGRNALSGGDYRTAAAEFRALRQRYPRSGYVGDAFYWEAFALGKIGGRDDLRTAVALLDQQGERYPNARTIRDARDLRIRLQGDLARLGDAGAAVAVAEAAAPLAAASAGLSAAAVAAPMALAGAGSALRAAGGMMGAGGECDDEDDERSIALNALINMNAEQAMPILKVVLARRDTGSVCLRRQAVFMISQKRMPETAQILLNTVRTDPDREVRENAVFWLSQAPTPEAIAALDSILTSGADRKLQDNAVFALSQVRDERASRALRAHLERADTPEEIKENIVFWLGQRRSEENAQYLKDLFNKTTDSDLKDKILFSVSQMSLESNARWLLGIAQDQNQGMELRKNALFWAGQMKALPFTDLAGLYDRVTDHDMKGQLIFVYSQRGDSAAVDKLMDIARHETDPDLRKGAIFWLGQSHDPRAAQLLLELINK